MAKEPLNSARSDVDFSGLVEGEVRALREARERLGAEVERLGFELAQAREMSQTQAVAQAAELGAVRGRAEEAHAQAERLRVELAQTQRRKSDEAQARLHAELDQLKAQMHHLDVEQVRAAAAIEMLRRDHTAALASLPRPEPIDTLPKGLTPQETADYLVLTRSSLMDPRWYLARHPDVADAGVDPALHYLQNGWREGRQPGPAFDGQNYLRANPDVAEAGINPLVHYQLNGALELRTQTHHPKPNAETVANSFPFQTIRIITDLSSHSDFLEFRLTHPEAFTNDTEQAVVAYARVFGTRTAFLGNLGQEHTDIRDGDLRESLMSGSLNSRVRAVADLILEEQRTVGLSTEQIKIYGHEAITYFATLMRLRFPRFVGSEYALCDEEKRRIIPYIHNDVCASHFPNDTFDIIFSCDVLEHVYNRDAALRETARNLVPGGTFIATFPFFYDKEIGAVFAEIKNGEIIHNLEKPIYHGNPVDPKGGSLVFEIPGWDIIGRARRAGFSSAKMRFICDEEKGITASAEEYMNAPRGVFVFVGRK